MRIDRLESGLRAQAAKVLSDAFFEYPMFRLYFPDSGKRAHGLPWYLENVLRCAMRYGEVRIARTGEGEAGTPGEISGVVFTLPPDHTKITIWEYLQNGFLGVPLVMGFRNYGNSMKCEAFVADTHERLMAGRPHVYLWGLVVAPGHQRQGIGSGLMRPILEKADNDRLPVYLETHDEKNVAYYRRMGFELVYTGTIEKFGLHIWCMVREPALG